MTEQNISSVLLYRAKNYNFEDENPGLKKSPITASGYFITFSNATFELLLFPMQLQLVRTDVVYTNPIYTASLS